ncbi:MAG: phosphatase PAP2 family protein [Candidatus Aminicenantes bacterium]|nr:MAG: phosphatase PAP2 family protein [Candidatus Aminicenantes bacterium]
MIKVISLKRYLAFMIVLVFVFSIVFPQKLICEETRPKDYRLNKEFLIGFGNDVYNVVTAPGNWEGKDWWRLTAVLGTGALLYAFDQKIHDWSQDRRTSETEDWARFGSTFGNGLFLGGLITSLYLGGEIFDEKSLRKTALLSLESWLTAGAVVLSLKAVLGRARPYTGLGSHHFEPFSFSSRYYSFPSGHAASAFAVATVIADQTDFILADVLAYSLSTLVAVSRVHQSKHWASDIFIGAAIGYFIGKKICSLHRDKDSENFQLGLNLSPNAKGITIKFSF